MFRTTSALPAAALLLAAPLALTGCGFGGDRGGASSSTTLPTSTGTATTAPAPSASEQPSSSTSTSSTGDSTRPTREQVISGVKQTYGTGPLQAVLDPDKLATCVTDAIYDVVSTATLQAIANATPADITEVQDIQTVTKAVATCTPKSTRPGAPSLPTDLPTSLPSLPSMPSS